MCNYLNEDGFTQLKRETPRHLNIFSMNIDSLRKHDGELLVFLKLLETDFDIVVLTEMGSRNIYLVKHLLNDYDFYSVTPLNNMYGGVGIYVSSNINNVLVLDNIAVEETCLCPKCEIESPFLNFSYMNESYVIGGIYRQPNGIVNHFVNDLENTLVKFDNKTTIIIAGDMNIDFIKFENDNTINYLTQLFSQIYTCPMSLCQQEQRTSLLRVLVISLLDSSKIVNHNLIKLCLASFIVTLPTICLVFSPLKSN